MLKIWHQASSLAPPPMMESFTAGALKSSKPWRMENATPSNTLPAMSAAEVFWQREFEVLGVPLTVTTADGTQGVRGFVTDAMAPLEGKYDYVYACGPEPMLRAVHALCEKQDIHGQFSFEERMACGFGVCMGCSCKTKYGSKRICKDGPVLRREEILW